MDARPAPAVGLVLETLHAQGRRDIAQARQFVHQGLVEQGPIGEGEKVHVVVLAEQPQQTVLEQERLAPGEHHEVVAHLLALGEQAVEVVFVQLALPGVQTGVAATAVEVAAHGGADGHDERDPFPGVADTCPQAGAAHSPMEHQVADEPAARHRVGQAADAHQKVGGDAPTLIQVPREAFQESPQKRAGEGNPLEYQQLAQVLYLSGEAAGERWDRQGLDQLLSQEHTRRLSSALENRARRPEAAAVFRSSIPTLTRKLLRPGRPLRK